jgi:anti-sigma factor RsiW
MRCSSFEPLLDRYVDGELAPRVRARVAKHVLTCANCAGLLEEFRVIDALLLQPRRIEAAPNFTFKVMADVRSLPRPRPHHVPPLPLLASYLVFGWVAIGGFLLLGGSGARAMLGWLATEAGLLGAQLGSLAQVTGHLFGSRTYGVTAVMGALLGADLLAAAAVVAVVVAVRARRAIAAGSEPG